VVVNIFEWLYQHNKYIYMGCRPEISETQRKAVM
jgi:hypothetical protein